MSKQTEDPVFINTSIRNMSKGIENEDKEERNKKKTPSQQLTKDLWYRNVLQVRINQNGVSQSKFTKRNRNK